MSKAIQRFTISVADPKQLVTEILKWGKAGAWLPDDEYPQLSHYPKNVKLAIEVIDGVGFAETNEYITAFSPIYDAKSFTKDELDNLSWDEFKSTLKLVGITGRDRTLMTRRYIEFVGEESVDNADVVVVEKPKKTTRKTNSQQQVSKTTEVDDSDPVSE